MITSATITDEQIGELAESFDDMNDQAQADAYDMCTTAVHAPARSERRLGARAWCAEALNQRRTSTHGLDPILRVLRQWDWTAIAEEGVTRNTEIALLEAAKALAAVEQQRNKGEAK